MKIAILNDTHCGVRNSSDIFINYQESFYKKVFFPYLKEHGIKHILHLGDYYEHRKYINFKALNANRKHFLQKLREYGITMDIIPGNHDTYYKNTNELNSLKELLGHYMNEVTIHEQPIVKQFGSTGVALIPWINKENIDDTMKFINNTLAPIVMGHFEFSGFEMHRGHVSTRGMKTAPFSRFDRVLSGHYHTKSSVGNIDYLGSQMEFTWADLNDQKYFHIWDSETNKLDAIPNPITLYMKALYDDKTYNYENFDYSGFENKFVKVIVVAKNDVGMFEAFIDNIQQQDIHDLKISETFYESGQEEADVSVEETSVLLDSYIDGIETSLDKKKLKSRMKDLYTQAQNQEVV